MKFAQMMMSDSNPHDDSYWRMVYDMGGITELEKFEISSDLSVIKQIYKIYGLEYVDEPTSD